MIKYLENRIWSLNARIIKIDAEIEEINNQLASRLSDGLFAQGGVRFSYTPNPVGNYSLRQTEITLESTAIALRRYQDLLDQAGLALRATSLKLIINTFGFLNIISIFEFTESLNDKNLNSVEKNGDAAAEILDGLFGDISALVDALHDTGIIQKSPDYHFGVPSALKTHGNHTHDDSYNYLVHIFYFEEKEVLTRTVSLYQAGENHMTYEGQSFFAIFPLYFWELNESLSDSELINLVSIDSYMTSELVAVNNALHVYNSFLDVLNMNKDVDSNHLRKIFNYNTWLIQNLRLFNPNFTLYQFRFIKMYRSNSDIMSKYELLKDAEQSLTFAIEGIEVSRTQQSERIMQFILALFTALTLYSVITDVYGFITNGEKPGPVSLYSLQTIIFSLETVVVLVFIFLFRKIIKRV